ncbi:MAG: hypothetical protein AAGE94_11945 [Acidobacteriota bacterium]
MNDRNLIRPWTEELIPAAPERASQRQLLTYIACAMRRQLEISMPEGATLQDGELVLPDRD